MKNIILGCPFDNGIRSMLRFDRGITGAATGSTAVVQQFARQYAVKYPKTKIKILPLVKYNLAVSAQNINNPTFRKKQKAATVLAHDKITAAIEKWCQKKYIPIGVGGDHSVSYPLCRGVCRAHPYKKFGVIYFDAHFDMRPLDPDDAVGGVISSGNPFRRLIEDERLAICGKNVVAVGIHNSKSDIYKKLEDYAFSQKVTVIFDEEVKRGQIKQIAEKALAVAGQGTDLIYFSVDIDGIDGRYAPGVSAPAENGITDKQLYDLIKIIASDHRVIAFDVAETSARELSWLELTENGKKQETGQEKIKKLIKTAKVAAGAIDCFLNSKIQTNNRKNNFFRGVM